MKYFTENSNILSSDKKYSIFYNKSDLGYRICKKYNDHLYMYYN
jgi:hypothetical protein